jgi:hypothetical protein
MKTAIILGTRPEIIKMSPAIRELERKNIARAVKLESALDKRGIPESAGGNLSAR